jgi:4-hydroxy-2-oxoheptanedioate aldolase
MAGLAEYMRGLVEGGSTRSGHRTPTVIVEAPVNGTDAANVRFNAWQFRQILGRCVHGVLLCQAESALAVRAFTAIRTSRPVSTGRAGRNRRLQPGRSEAS